MNALLPLAPEIRLFCAITLLVVSSAAHVHLVSYAETNKAKMFLANTDINYCEKVTLETDFSARI